MKRALALTAALLALGAGLAPSAGATACTGPQTISTGLQATINNITIIGPGDCVINLNTGSYNETIVIPSTIPFANPQARLIISSAPAALVNILGGTSGGSVFKVDLDSVTLIGLQIKPNSTSLDAVELNGSMDKLSSSTISDPSSLATGYIVQVAGSSATISNDIISGTYPNAYGVQFNATAPFGTVIQSSITAVATGGQAALTINAASVTVRNSYIEQDGGTAVVVQFTNGAQILASTIAMTSPSPMTNAGLYISNSYGVTVATLAVQSAAVGVDVYASSQNVLTNLNVQTSGATRSLYVENGSHDDLISLSTITNNNTGTSGTAVEMFMASSITFTYSMISNWGNADAFYASSSGGFHTIAHSSITKNGGGSFNALHLLAQSASTVSDSVLHSDFGSALFLDSAGGNTVTRSTMTNGATSFGALYINNSSGGNTISQSYIYNSVFHGAQIGGSSYSTQILQSTMTTGGASGGSALSIDGGAHDNRIYGSVISASQPSAPAVRLAAGGGAAYNNVLDACSVSNGSGAGMELTSGSYGNAVLNTSIVAGSTRTFGGAVLDWQASSNTFTNLTLTNTSGLGTGNGFYAAQSSSITITGGSFSDDGQSAGTASLVFDNTHNSAVTGVSLNNASGPALYLYQSSSDTLNGVTASGGGSVAAALLSSDSADTLNALTVSNNASNPTAQAVSVINGGGLTIQNSTFTSTWSHGLKITGSNGDTLQSSVVKSAKNTALVLSASNSNTLTQDMLNTVSTGAFAALEDFNGSSNQLQYSYAVATNSLQGAVWLSSGTTSDVVNSSTITSNASTTQGAALVTNLATNIAVNNSYLAGGNGALLDNYFGNSGDGFNGSTITAQATLGVALSITNAQSASTTTLNATSLYAPAGGAALTTNLNDSADSVVLLNGSVGLHGNVAINGGGLSASGGQAVFGGDLLLSTGSFTSVSASTFSFSGGAEVPLRTAQTLTLGAQAFLDAVTVNVASFTAAGSWNFQANSFSDLVAGSTVAFTPGTPFPYHLGALTLRGGPAANGRVVFRSKTAGAQANVYVDNVAASSITLAQISDLYNQASAVGANDGTSIDGGNNLGFIFQPQLDIEVPGQTWTEGSGKTGTPSNAAAGTVSVVVRAVSSGNGTVASASIPVTLWGNDVHDSTMTQTLVGGATTFLLPLPRAEDPVSHASPFNHILTVVSTGAYNGSTPYTYNDFVPVVPGALSKLVVLLQGESADPGGSTGKTGAPAPLVATVPFGVDVRGVDARGNLVSSANDSVMIATSASNLPLTQSLSPLGYTHFASVAFSTTGTGRDIVAMDLSNGAITASTSTAFSVFPLSVSSPTVTINIANVSTQTTLGGAISGTASDPTAVTQVRVAIQKVTGLPQYYDWTRNPQDSNSFNLGAPQFATATLSTPNQPFTAWSISFPDAALLNSTSYYVTVISSDPSNNTATGTSLFTFNPTLGQVGSSADGSGLATVTFETPAGALSNVGCGPISSSITFVSTKGLGAGAQIAVHIPDTWSTPAQVVTGTLNPSPNTGDVVVGSTPAYTAAVNPPGFGNNWILYTATNGMPPGTTIYFTYTGYTGGGPQAVGPQTFLVQTMGGTGGLLKPIASQPTAVLNPGAPASLQFSNQQYMTLGPLQTSSTMFMFVSDACGNNTVTAQAKTITLSASQFGTPDPGGQFYLAGGVSTNSVALAAGALQSTSFYFLTSTPGPFFEQLQAQTTFFTTPAFAYRYAQVLASSVSISGVSIDTGTLQAGVKVATMTPGSFSGAAVINFSLSNPNLPWEVIISTDNVSFYPELVHRNGYGQPGRSVSWYGVTELGFPQTLVKPGGPYYVKIRAGGVAEDNTLSLYMAPSAFVYGTVNSTGAYAYVSAQGPNTSYANFAVASSTGYFEIYGLANGARYNIVGTTGSVINGQFVQIQTSSFNVTAANGGTNIGAIPFPTPSFLRVRGQLPQATQFEFWGGVNAFSNTGQNAWGTLHYLPGTDKSDDGNQLFGGAASTWTVLGVAPGTYNVQLNLQQVSISSTIPNVVVQAGQTTDLFVALQRKANVYGLAVIPSTSSFGTSIGIQGTKAGQNRPSVFGGVYLQSSTSAVYSLYGLDPGTWTITAHPNGFASASTNVFISSTADVGDPVLGGVDLFMSSGTALSGAVVLTGDSRNLPNAQNGGITLGINAFNPQTFTGGFAQVFLATSAVSSRSTFTITGLDPGSYYVNTYIQGAQQNGPQVSTNVPAGGGYTTLGFNVDSARAQITIALPASPAPDFHTVGLFVTGPSTTTQLQDFTTLPGAVIFTTSATWMSPVLSPGYFQVTANYGKLGTSAVAGAEISDGRTTPLFLDLGGSTFTVSGTVVVGGNVNLNINNTAVSVSSVPGILAYTAPNEYCLGGFVNGVATPTFHLELLPITRNGNYWTQPLTSPQTHAVAGNCANPEQVLQNQNGGTNGGNGGNFNDASPFLAYLINISTDGSFVSPGVPAGRYILRVPTNLDNAGGTGPDELPPVRQLVTVTTSNVAGVSFTITQGVTVSGNVRMPSGLNASRPMQVSLNDSQGNPIRTSFVNFANVNAAPYSLDRVPDGTYALIVQDNGATKSFGARPITLKVSGAAISQDIQLVQTGIIKGSLAVKQFLPGSTTSQYVIVDQHNADQLPGSFQLYAEANPWFQGGRAFADSSCGGGPTPSATCGGNGKPSFDANGEFTISGVLPGLYDVHFQTGNDPNDNGSLKVVSSFAPGISVNGGATTDLGTYNLTAGVTLRGRVTDATTGNPVPSVPMRAQASLTQSHEVDTPRALTDANGNFQLVGFDPSVKVYDIYAGKPDDNGVRPPYELKVSPSVDITSVTVLDFSIVPASYSVSGQILGVAGGPPLQVPFNENGTPQLGAAVFIQKNGVQPHDNPIADVQVITDAQGRFTIPSLTTGTYKLTVASLGYGSVSQNVSLSTSNVTLAAITLPLGGTVSGALRKPDGSNPSQREVDTVVAVTNNFSSLLIATLTPDQNANTFTNYSIAGFQPGQSYRILIFGKGGTGAAIAPSEGSNIVFSTTTESRSLDLVLRPAAPYAFSKSRRSGAGFTVRFELSQPLRDRQPSDEDLTTILSTFSALGTLSGLDLDASRSILTATYAPAVGESSFTLRLHGYSTQTNPDSLDPVNPQFVYDSTFSFFTGVDGHFSTVLSNFNGGTLVVEDDNGRVAIPGGAFQVDASSSISIGLLLANEGLTGASALRSQGIQGAAANIKAMRYSGSAYPQELLRAVAATPPQVNPLSSFYNILLPLGIRTALQKPVPLTISYSTSTDPNTLNLYWYNAAANAYVLQQDVTGAKPVIDTVNHTITINVNHFSTFVMFNTNVAVITGDVFGGDFTAYNFPNPFDLSVKNVTSIHGAGVQSVRGTMISVSVPPDASGDGSIRIFNVAGEKVRTISLGTVAGGRYYYQPWDGRNDSGRDVASGVYIGQVKIGDRSKFFKMALIK